MTYLPLGKLADAEAAALAGIDFRNVHFPAHEKPRREMVAKIKALAAEGYIAFGTQTNRCLNYVGSPEADSHPAGWDYYGFWHDCEEKEADTGDYWDISLFARK